MNATGSSYRRENPILKRFHHAAVICCDYDAAIDFYVNKLGLRLYRETFIKEKNKRKLELWLGDVYVLEIFIITGLPEDRKGSERRTGFNHLSFLVEDVSFAAARLREVGVRTAEVMYDEIAGKQYAFFFDPDGHKLELYQE